MWRELFKRLKRESQCEEAFSASLDMLRSCHGMFEDAVASLRQEGALQVDIYARDRSINKFERLVRRDIITHLAISTNPDINTALVLTAIVIDIERIGDYTKNIVELAAMHPCVFSGGDLAEEILEIEAGVRRMFAELIPVMGESDAEQARQILGDHQMVADRVEGCLRDMIGNRVLQGNTGQAVAAALYLRYLKRISAHLKNVATSIVNPYYRIGFREKGTPLPEPRPLPDPAEMPPPGKE